MRTIFIAIAITLTACGGAVEPSRTEPAKPVVTCGTAKFIVTAQVQASADTTACLNALCQSVPTCDGVTAAQPVCVVETNGGQLLSTNACAVGCCY